MPSLFLILALTALVVVVFRFYACYKLNYWKRRGIEQLPESGNIHKNAVNKSAPMLSFYILHKPCLMLRDPELIKQVMIRDFENFSDRHFAGSQQKDSFGMKNLFGLKNPAWKYLRSKITPTLTRSKLRQMLPLMMQTSEPMMQYLEAQGIEASSEKMIDAQDINYKYATDLIANIALGTPTDSFNYPNKDFTKAEFEGENLLYQSGAFFSGFESSSTTAAFTLLELAGSPEHQQLARQDIERAVSEHGGLTYEAFNDMKYLDQCVAEGVRLHPPVSTIDRHTRKDYKIPGTNIVIEKGTPIYISLYGIHEDPRFFDRPEVFDPTRFDDDKKRIDAYLPFGIGPRMCVAMKVGQLHAKVVLAKLLREYAITQRPENKLVLDPRSTLVAAADGINLHFRKIVK